MLLLEFPNELIERFLIELHPMDVVLLRQVCQYFMNIIDNSIELELRIELAVDGFLLGDRGDMMATDILKLVLERRRAFERIRPRMLWEVKVPGANNVQLELSDGVWGLAPLAEDGTFKKIRFEELVPPDTPGGRWTFSTNDLGIDCCDFSFWLDADALFVIEKLPNWTKWRLHLRQLSNNAVHRRAFAPFIDLEDPDEMDNCRIVSNEERLLIDFYQFVGPVNSKRTAAIIFDWTTGNILLPYTRMQDIAFLTKDLIILLPNHLPNESALTLEVRSLELSCTLYRCELPLWATRHSLQFIKRSSSNHGRNCPTRHAKLFVPDPRVDILGILATPIEGTPEEGRCTIILSIPIFLRVCHKLLGSITSHSTFKEAVVFPWSQWGPNTTRWIANAVLWSYMLYGSRILATIEPPSGWAGIIPQYSVLMDFNPRPIRRGSIGENHNETLFSTAREESQYNVPGIEQEGLPDTSVTSTLPLRMWEIELEDLKRGRILEANSIITRVGDTYRCFSFLPFQSTQ